jgi:hypothetical protein
MFFSIFLSPKSIASVQVQARRKNFLMVAAGGILMQGTELDRGL